MRFYALENRRRRDVLQAIEQGDIDEEEEFPTLLKKKRRTPKKKTTAQIVDMVELHEARDAGDEEDKKERVSPRGIKSLVEHTSADGSHGTNSSDHNHCGNNVSYQAACAYPASSASAYPNLSMLSNAAAALPAPVPPQMVHHLSAASFFPQMLPQSAVPGTSYYQYCPYGHAPYPSYPHPPFYGNNDYFFQDPRKSHHR